MRPDVPPDAAGDSWWDDEAGPFVRPFARVRGRTKPSRDEFNLITLILVVGSDETHTGLEPEHAAILRVCAGGPTSVAEISARMKIPLSVTKILLADLLDAGAIRTRAPIALADGPDIHILQAVLDGIRRI